MQAEYLNYILYAAAYFFSITAFFFNSVSTLRLFTIISSTCYAIYYFTFPTEPMWLDIGTEGLLVVVNIVMLGLFFFREKRSVLSIEENEIHESIFSDFSVFEFYKLAKTANWNNYNQGIQLIEKGAEVENIHLIYSGEVLVQLDDERNIILKDGNFIGERSFSINEHANAYVETLTKTRLITWNQKELKALFKRNQSMKKSFELAITNNLARKLDL